MGRDVRLQMVVLANPVPGTGQGGREENVDGKPVFSLGLFWRLRARFGMDARLTEGVDEDGRDWKMRTLLPFKNEFRSKSGNLNGHLQKIG